MARPRTANKMSSFTTLLLLLALIFKVSLSSQSQKSTESTVVEKYNQTSDPSPIPDFFAGPTNLAELLDTFILILNEDPQVSNPFLLWGKGKKDVFRLASVLTAVDRMGRTDLVTKMCFEWISMWINQGTMEQDAYDTFMQLASSAQAFSALSYFCAFLSSIDLDAQQKNSILQALENLSAHYPEKQYKLPAKFLAYLMNFPKGIYNHLRIDIDISSARNFFDNSKIFK